MNNPRESRSDATMLRTSRAILLASAGLLALLGCGTGDARDAGDARADTAPDARVASALISADGGTLSVGGASITVPPGALATPQTITVTVTDVTSVPGYVLYSPVYRFEPQGLVFARPASVTLPFTGDAARAGMYWSRAGAAGFERLAGTVATNAVTALVTHFSDGFVGDESATPDASSGDASDDVARDAPFDALPDSGRGSDAGPAICPSVQAIDPSTRTTAITWTSIPADPASPSYPVVYPCFRCTSTRGGPVGTETATIQLTAPMVVTLWRQHSLIEDFDSQWGISSDCRTGASMCIDWGNYPRIVTRRLEPGVYQLQRCGIPAQHAVIEPPPPLPTNTSCATAAPLGRAEPRVLDTMPRYYAFRSGGGALVARSAMNQGSIMTVSVRRVCDDPASEVARGSAPYVLGPTTGTRIVDLNPLGPGDFFAVVSGISQGLEYTLTME